MRTAKIIENENLWQVQLREFEGSENSYSEDLTFSTSEAAQQAAYHFMTEYVDFVPFEDEED